MLPPAQRLGEPSKPGNPIGLRQTDCEAYVAPDLASAAARYERARRVAAQATVVAKSSTHLASPVVRMGGMEAGS